MMKNNVICVIRSTGTSLSLHHRKFEGGSGKLSVVINNSEEHDFSQELERHAYSNQHTPTTTTTALVTLSRRTSQMLVLFSCVFVLSNGYH